MTASEDDLGPACTDLRCGWVSVPHVHEDDAVYPLPPDRPEWIAALAADEEADRARRLIVSKRPDDDRTRLASIREALTAANGDWHFITALWSIQADLHWLLKRAEATTGLALEDIVREVRLAPSFDAALVAFRRYVRVVLSSPETTPDACLDVERLAKALENAPIWDPDDGGMLGPIETIAAEVAAQYAVIVGGKPCRRRAGDGEECGEAYGHAGPHHPRARVHAADDACPNCGLPLTTHKDFGCPDEIAFCAFPTMDGPCGSLAGHESVHMGSGPSS